MGTWKDPMVFEPAQSPVGSRLIANSKLTGETMLSAIRRLLSQCDSFEFCVAFISSSGLQPFIQVLDELRERGVGGRLLTSTYQNFNSPAVFEKLLEFENIETRVYQGNLHAKGYLFREGDSNAVIIGSSNLTQSALTINKEWNILVRSDEGAEVVQAAAREFQSLWNGDEVARLDERWIAEYRAFRAGMGAQQKGARSATAFAMCGGEGPAAPGVRGLHPNKMQVMALDSLQKIHRAREPRALLVSATGTGKTFLSAFDILRERPNRVLFVAHRKRILSASMESYQRLLGSEYCYKLYEPGKPLSDRVCLFAMVSTLSRHLDEFDPVYFNYIVIDEAHRVGAESYQRILGHFSPEFCFGMTATPTRTDGYDVFALFNHVIAYQITLQDALENDMLVPFHYFGIADLSIDYEQQDDLSLFSKLTSDERVRHVVQKIEEYSIDRDDRRGLIFCNRNDEAKALSDAFNRLGYRTVALSGDDGDDVRNAAIARLESGELQYIFSVDILNEGIDIPSLNQVIMLRRTESAIVFVQQLGRGLRKCEGKEYTLVLDFIGNYQKNFLVPVALSGDKTFNKDRLRSIVASGGSCIPGASTISFDRIAESRIYRAIDGGDFTAARFLRDGYLSLRRMLGRIPSLEDFDEHGSIDPLLIFKKYGSYHAFLCKYEQDYSVSFSSLEERVLRFISQKLANGKRFEDLYLLRELIHEPAQRNDELIRNARREFGVTTRATLFVAAANVLDGGFSADKGFIPLMLYRSGRYELLPPLLEMLADDEFKRQLLEVIDFGLRRQRSLYGSTYKDTSFVLNAKYTYEEVCRLLCWDKNINGQNIGGYKFDRKTNTYPVFINYDKAPDISDSIRYEDRFVSRDELIAISKQPRTLSSPEIQRLREMPENGMKAYLFVRKNKDDKESKEFYFLGEIYPTGSFTPIVMPRVNKSAVEITYRLDVPVRQDLYDYFLSDIEDPTLQK